MGSGDPARQRARYIRSNTLGYRVGRFAALPRQAMKGIDQEGPWKPLR